MSNDSHNQDHSDFETISPAKIEITSSNQAEIASEKVGHQNKVQHSLLMGSLLVLVVVALGVIFVLPRFVDKPVLTTDQQKSSSNKNITGVTPQGSQVSPWQDAQQIKLRKQVNDVLADVLEKQALLEEKKVGLWGADAFDQAKKHAQKGDKAYREKMFGVALESFELALSDMEKLLGEFESVVKKNVEQGEEALITQDALLAEEAFMLVLNLVPSHTEAEAGLVRAQSLNQVIMLLDQAKEKENNDQLDDAFLLFQQALKLDAETTVAKEGIQRLNAKIAEQSFNGLMSQGFLNLSQKKYSMARKAFSQALKLKPKSQDARDGLDQSVLQLTQSNITRLRKQAEQLVRNESWQKASERYDEVLQLDNSLQFAQAGKKLTGTRLRLDELLVTRIQKPERLSSTAVFKETQALLSVAKKLSSPGPRLRGQITRIETQLKLAVIPVSVNLKSDNLTEVSIKRMGDLGKFFQHEIRLKPGEYIVVGKRLGYRDVRMDIVISPNVESGTSKGVLRPPILIQCTEKI